MSWTFVKFCFALVLLICALFGVVAESHSQDVSYAKAPLNDPYIPRIKVTPEPPLEGKNVSLVCSAYYDIDFILFPKWTLPNPSLLKSERVSVNKVITVTAGDRQGVNTLFLAHATPQDQGDYTCRVIDLLGNTFQKTYKLTLEKDTEEKTSVGLSS